MCLNEYIYIYICIFIPQGESTDRKDLLVFSRDGTTGSPSSGLGGLVAVFLVVLVSHHGSFGFPLHFGRPNSRSIWRWKKERKARMKVVDP